MQAQGKSQEQLIEKLEIMSQQIVELRTSETGLKQELEALKKENTFLRLVIDLNPNLIYVKDRQNRCVLANQAFADSYGTTVEKLLGVVTEHLEPDLAERFHQMDLEVMDTRQEKLAPVRQRDYFGGEVRWTQTIKRPIIEGDGSCNLVLGVATDITNLKRAEEALKTYSEQLEEMVEIRTKELQETQERLIRQEKLAILGQLAGGVGHELRNPLGVISNAVYFLKMVLSEADEVVKEYLEIISTRIDEAEKIVSDLLNLSRTRPTEKTKITVSTLVAEVLERHPSPESVMVTTQVASNLPGVFVNSQQIGQVLVNLVTNAYQAMPEGGRLTISARAEQDHVSLSITDTGHGISPEIMEKIFEPLFTTRANGIGLGLAVSKNLLEINGGSITVDSAKRQGSTFVITLPIKD